LPGPPSHPGGITISDPSPASTLSLQPFDRSRRETISTEIARQLLAYLLAGDIRPGQKIPSERKLSEALGVGRSVVREALKSLTLLGLVEVRQGDGTYLRSTESSLLPDSIEWGLLLGQKRIRDLIEARRLLEEVLAGLAAERRDAADLAALRELLGDMREAAARHDPEAFTAADVAFHLRVSQSARNETLGQVLQRVATLLRVWISRVMHAAESFTPSLDEHVLVCEAIEQGEASPAREAMRRHLELAFERLAATLPADDALDGRYASVAHSAVP
jgi:GntR family transcriptional repressor for pyruvate dehydrogenase complex